MALRLVNLNGYSLWIDPHQVIAVQQHGEGNALIFVSGGHITVPGYAVAWAEEIHRSGVSAPPPRHAPAPTPRPSGLEP